jgi:hypothetical protein
MINNKILDLCAYRARKTGTKLFGNICADYSCQSHLKCANHISANPNRERDGYAPDIHFVDGILTCNRRLTKSTGMLLIEDGKLVSIHDDLSPFKEGS